jgi:hypothetical protein
LHPGFCGQKLRRLGANQELCQIPELVTRDKKFDKIPLAEYFQRAILVFQFRLFGYAALHSHSAGGLV